VLEQRILRLCSAISEPATPTGSTSKDK